MNKLQTIREVCIKANDDIVALKFGCEINAMLCREKEPIDDYPMDTFIISRKDTVEKFEVSGLTHITHNQHLYLLYSVIGRPIHLADVLLAIENRKGADLFFGRGIGLQGRHVEVKKLTIHDSFLFAYGAIPIILRDWNFKETLENQKEETKNFIYTLLIK